MERASIVYDEYTTDELLKMKKDEATEGLNEKQQRFCENYINSYNVKSAAAKAGYKVNYQNIGYVLRRRPAVKRYIQWLKARVVKNAVVQGSDIIEQWIKIAFADITDFVNIHRNSISMKPADEIDGQLIKSIKTTQHGVTFELHDKLKALDSLSRYTSDMPKDFRQLLEERKMQLLEEEFKIKREQHEHGSMSQEDDGFIEALKATAKEVWEDEEKI